MENLLNNPEYESSLYVDRVTYDPVLTTLSIVFNEGPDAFVQTHELIFENVTHFSEELLDGEDYPGKNNFTDALIGFDLTPSGFCLHLTTVEYLFKSKSKPKIVRFT